MDDEIDDAAADAGIPPTARLARLRRYPVKGFGGHDVAGAVLRPGGGLPGDRILALANGQRPVPPAGRWRPTGSFVRLTTHTDLLVPAVTLAGDTVVLRHPDRGELRIAPDDPASRAAATRTLRVWFGLDPAAELVRADRAYWDEPDGAVSVINLDSVAALAAAAGRPIDPARFRGNLYLAGLGAWAEFGLVGRRIRVGDVTLELLRPMNRCRATCVDPATSRVDVDVPAELTARFGHLYCGVRARVLTGGTLHPGDRVVASECRGDRRRAAPRPVPVWDAAGRRGVRWPRPARIVRRHTESDDVVSLWLRDPLAATRAVPRAGQHLRVHAADGAGPVWRCYTISAVAGADLRISVRRAAGGRMSGLLHDTAAGGEVLISGPYGSTVLDGDTAPLLIAGAGIGITQTLALLRACRPERRLVFCHTARDERSLALWPEIEALAAELPNVRLRLHLTAGTADACRRLGAAPGRPDLGAIAARYFAEPAAIAAYLCGPPAFLRDARTALTGRGVPDRRIRHEVYASPRGVPAATPPPSPGPYPVTLSASGRTVDWTAADGSLLDTIERAGLAVPSGCRSGACQQCRQPLRAGTVAYTAEPALPPEPGTVLPCCTVPTSPVTLPL